MKFIKPPIWLTILIVPLAISFLIYAMVFIGVNSIEAYIAYAFATYALIILCVRIPALIKSILHFKNENQYIQKWSNDLSFRVNLSLYGSLMWNFAYAIFQFVLGYVHQTFWYYSFGGYYLTLAIMRFFLAQHTKKYKPGEKMREELIKYRRCGYVFFFLNVFLSIIVFFMIYWHRTFQHHEITTIAMAAFTFFSMGLAIVNVIKYRQYHSPVYQASKNINLVAACVSILTLESSMLTTFGKETLTVLEKNIFLGATGAGICIIFITMSIRMIVYSTKKLKQLKMEEY